MDMDLIDIFIDPMSKRTNLIISTFIRLYQSYDRKHPVVERRIFGF